MQFMNSGMNTISTKISFDIRCVPTELRSGILSYIESTTNERTTPKTWDAADIIMDYIIDATWDSTHFVTVDATYELINEK
jgi:hypothetical protein